jgi:hypothetical protein
MSFLKSLGGGIIDAVTSTAGDYMSNELIGKPNAEDAYHQSQQAAAQKFAQDLKTYRHRYQYTMRDMQLAGLNPILAAGSGGFNISGIPQMAQATAFQPHSPYGSFGTGARNLSEAAKNIDEQRRIRADTSKILQEMKLTRSKRKAMVEQILKTRAETALLTQRERNEAQRMFNLEQELYHVAQQIIKTRKEAEHISLKQDLTKAETNIAQAKFEQIRVDTERITQVARQISMVCSQLRRKAEVYDGPVGSVLMYVKEILQSLGINVGIITGLGGKKGIDPIKRGHYP